MSTPVPPQDADCAATASSAAATAAGVAKPASAGTGDAARQDAGWAALVLHPRDDVAVALRDLARGESVAVRCGAALRRITAGEAIPLGHKVALHAVAAGAPLHKYGERIGHATVDIAAGMHVHVHNMASARARSAS
jgi:altronate dehydratase